MYFTFNVENRADDGIAVTWLDSTRTTVTWDLHMGHLLPTLEYSHSNKLHCTTDQRGIFLPVPATNWISSLFGGLLGTILKSTVVSQWISSSLWPAVCRAASSFGFLFQQVVFTCCLLIDLTVSWQEIFHMQSVYKSLPV